MEFKSIFFADNHPMTIEDWLTILALAGFPLLFLTLRGWTNIFTFVLLLITLYHFLSLPKLARSIKNINAAEWWVVASLSAGFLAILISQLLRHSIEMKPYDGPLRMLLAAPIFLFIVRKKINFVRVFEYICPISILIIFISVTSNPAPTIAADGRYATYFVPPNAFGTYVMLLAFMCLFTINASGKDSKGLSFIKVLGFLAGLFLEMKSQTRGAWIAEPAMLALWVSIHWHLKSKLSLFISVAGTLVAIISAYFFVDFFHARVDSVYSELYGWLSKTNTETSMGYRLSMWKASWALFMQSPWHGYGDLGYQYKLTLPEFQSKFSSVTIYTLNKAGPHNEFLANMIRSGVFGLIAVILEFFVPAVVFIRGLNSKVQRVKSASAIGLCLVIGMLITSISIEVLTLKYHNSFYGLMIAALCATVLWKDSSDAVYEK